MQRLLKFESKRLIRISAAILITIASLLSVSAIMPANIPTIGTTVSAASDEYWEHLNKIRPKKPTRFAYKVTDNTLTVSWNKVEGASQYSVQIYDQSTKKFTDAFRTPRNQFTIQVIPGRTYKLFVNAEREITGLILSGPISDVITVRTKSNSVYKYPDMADFGFYDLSTETAKRIPNELAGAFGSEMKYTNKEELDKIIDMIDDYKIAMEDENFTFTEIETKEAEDCTMLLCSYKYKGIWAGDFSVAIYEDHVLIIVWPYDYDDYPNRGQYWV